MNKDKFPSAEDRVKELSPEEMQIIDSVMSNPQLYTEAYREELRSIYPGIDRKKVENSELPPERRGF